MKNNFRMKTQYISGSFKWEDIVFENHSVCEDGVQAVVEFDNGQFCSIVGGSEFLLGNGTTTFEIMSSSTITKTAQIKGWLSKEQVLRHLRFIQKKQ